MGGYQGWEGGRDRVTAFWDDDDILKLDSGDGCTSLSIY